MQMATPCPSSDLPAPDPEHRMLDAVRTSTVSDIPCEHLYMREVFAPDFYARLLSLLPPTDRFHDLRHRDAMRSDGSSARLRMYLYPEHLWRLPREHREVWTSVSRLLRSKALQDAFKQKFRLSLEKRFGRPIDKLDFYPIPILVRDQPG